jgi:hypothetical protein
MGMRTNIMWALLAGVLLLPAAAQPASAQDEGIKVHGDWVIEVRNPNGALVSRSEFQNALTSNGASILAQILARQGKMGAWYVEAHAANDAPLCSPVWSFVCGFGEGYSGTNGLTLERVGAALRLSGQFSVTAAGSLTSVRTGYNLCPYSLGDQALLACGYRPSGEFTAHQLPAPIQVQQGQIVQVTVRISFS